MMGFLANWERKLRKVPEMKTQAMKKWWLREHGSLWQEWALILPGGEVVVYDEKGHTVRRTSYGGRCRARSALKLKGFKRVKRKDLELVYPPQLA